MSSHDEAVLAAARTKFSYVFNVLNLLLICTCEWTTTTVLLSCLCLVLYKYVYKCASYPLTNPNLIHIVLSVKHQLKSNVISL